MYVGARYNYECNKERETKEVQIWRSCIHQTAIWIVEKVDFSTITKYKSKTMVL
jgi:hypothetical protein